MAVKTGDFVELEYTGKIKSNNEIFDTTNVEIAKKAGMDTEKAKFGPIIARVGEKIVLPGLDEALVGREVGTFTVDLLPEKAFGKKNPKLITLIATSKFLKKKVKPVRGLQLNIDGKIGTIKSVSGGRTVVDFNHPLAGKEVVYEVKITRIINDKKEQCKAAFEWMQFLPKEWDIKDNTCIIMVDKEVPDNVAKSVSEQMKKFTGVTLKFKMRTPAGAKTEDKNTKNLNNK